jgi:mannosyltransferase OCH1-like enzyme
MASRIPRRVHLMWKTEQVPPHWQQTVDNWRRLHPTWEHTLWTHATIHDFVNEHFPQHFARFVAYPHQIQRVDFARYCIISLLGGVYMDLDICPIESFEPLLQFYEARGVNVLVSESAGPVGDSKYSNAFLASAPGAPFWDVVFQTLANPYRGYKAPLARLFRHFAVVFGTGPGVVNASMLAFRRQRPDLAYTVDAVPRQLLQHTPHWLPRPCEAYGGMTRLLKGGSWHSWDSTMFTHLDHWWSARGFWAPVTAAVLFVLLLAALL